MRLLQVSALALATMLPLPSLAGDLVGSYLAARQASVTNDYDASVRYYKRALSSSPHEPRILEGLIQAQIAAGAADAASVPAERLEKMGVSSQIAQMALVVDDVEKGNYDALQARIEGGQGVGPLVDGLLAAWIHLGKGNMSEALAEFDKVSAQEGLERFARYHKALALAYVGDFQGAESIYAAQSDGPLEMTRRGALARIEVLSQLDRDKDALSLLNRLFGSDLNPELQFLKAALEANQTLPYTHITSVRDGVAEIFYSVAAALQSEASYEYTLLYARLAETLRPDHIDSLLLTGDLLEKLDRPELATVAYRKVPRDNPSFYQAELGRAEALRKAGRPDAAREVLEQLSADYPTIPDVQASLGDLQRQSGNHREAVVAYDKALALFADDDPSQWFLLYARGMSEERLGNWYAAKVDFLKALKFNPDQPNVLNYFGYSLVEKNERMEQALNMIQRAAELRPESGYIIDSLGWVLHRMGRNDEAVPYMEHAAELMPVDAVVNDHLGDVYWAAGRQLEAQFQWTRALSCDPEDKDADRIRRKLKVGLDAVVAEEATKELQQLARDDG
jgi:tetratricopeptide (TPR) repeat protein